MKTTCLLMTAFLLSSSLTRAQSDVAFTSSYPYQNISGTGTYSIYYANANNPVLKKPIIIVDGYDPLEGDQGGRGTAEIYGLFNAQPTLLADNLRSVAGYDIVILNFTNNDNVDVAGIDYIQRNAYTLETLLEKLYADNQSTLTDEFILLGPSMGGIISRYALAHMEADSRV